MKFLYIKLMYLFKRLPSLLPFFRRERNSYFPLPSGEKLRVRGKAWSQPNSDKLFLIPLIALLVGVSGCGSGSFLEGKKIEYKSASKLPPLEIPPDLTAPNRDDRYAVPDINPSGSATYSAYQSERKGTQTSNRDVLVSVDKTRIERSGAQRWLVVAMDPEKAYSLIKAFWQDQGFIIKQDSPDIGIMETDWAENRAKIPTGGIRKLIGKVIDQVYDSGERDKFRTRLERGSQPGTTEIYISHRGMTEVYTDNYRERTAWQPRPSDPELEAEMLSRLMVRFGVEESKAKEQLAAKKDENSRPIKDKEGYDVLEVLDPFDRAWRRVGLALDRIGFTVDDRDRSQGLYFVRYVDPILDNRSKQEKDGFLPKIKGRQIDPKAKSEPYQIKVKDQNNVSYVQVLNKEGIAENSATAKKILGLLNDQLK